MPWDPDRYHQFQKERSAPFQDLLALVRPRPDLEVIDLGCGTGELTQRLAEVLPNSRVLGIDASPEMLERARSLAGPRLRFEPGKIEDLRGQWDLVFSNAAIQWIDDHRRLVPQLYGLVRPGGQLAIQLPSNHNHPAHRSIVETARESPFREALDGWVRISPVLSIEDYAGMLFHLGAGEIVVFEKVYPHVLADADALADWTSGTALVPYMERLPGDLREPFMQSYRQKLRRIWPSGAVFFGFRRTLFSAIRPEE